MRNAIQINRSFFANAGDYHEFDHIARILTKLSGESVRYKEFVVTSDLPAYSPSKPYNAIFYLESLYNEAQIEVEVDHFLSGESD